MTCACELYPRGVSCPECKATGGRPNLSVYDATRGHPDFDEEDDDDAE